MKKTAILTFGLIAILGVACQNNKTTTETTAPVEAATEMATAAMDTMHMMMDTTATMMSDTTAMVYACQMHPEVTGKAGDKCPKCNMALTATHKHEDHTH
ncbi:MAG: hypothetical protein IPK94_20525 [Saprospiraceae bacterium]|jgi:phage FluMu protein Com|nr:hypothetical protein [Saprospiraceae bacterium]MBK6479695.1 hypothetical protein [Saprospiraceae bacterium]MBK7439074.1 hypothetical protein [Saprospiraceae bacterium]MBK7608004.1 hypothetical protein [Saprospiraceae bacterium]MBK8282456.1 hypothetical protein [Saprospiraceae bacterium]